MRHTTPLLNLLAVSTALICIVLSVLAPDILKDIELWILGFSIVLVGIPHGALDHLIAANVFEQGNRLIDHLKFYGWYIVLMVFIAGLWFIYPEAGLLLFLIISVLHFGQADIEGFYHADHQHEVSQLMMNSTAISRGIMIIGLILSAFPNQVLPILEAAVGTKSWFTNWLSESSHVLKWGVILQYGVIALLFLKTSILSQNKKLFFIVDSILITILFLTVPPLASFAVYFALWHSIGHIGEITSYFKGIDQPLTLVVFYMKALPFSLVSFAGLGVLLFVTQSLSMENQIISLTFVLISVLTLPHMVVAHGLIRSNTGQ